MLQTANVLTAIAILIHFALMIGEIFFWKQPFIHKRLGFNLTEATQAAAIVANAGLYNGFIASGLTWGIISGAKGYPIKTFFLACVIIAGLFGAVTLKPTTLLIQTLPGVAALVCVWLSRPMP